MKRNKHLRGALSSILLIVVPILGALLYHAITGQERVGADERAQETVRQLHSYRPWFEPLWSPPTPTVEALLFLAQAVAGLAVLGFAITRLRSKGKP